MTYESHTVRSLRRDPIPDETVRLVLTLGENEAASSVGEDETASTVTESVESLGGEVVRELEFERLLVEVEQANISEVVGLDGVTTVETDAVLDQT